MAVTSFAAWMIGLVAALKLSAACAQWLETHWNRHVTWLPVAVFILLFFLTALLVHLLGKLLEKALQTVALGWLNRLSGVLLYLFLYLIMFSIFLWLANQLYLISPTTKAHSVVYSWVAPLGPAAIHVVGMLIPAVSHVFQDLEHFFTRVGQHIQ